MVIASQFRCTSKSVDLYAGNSNIFKEVAKTVHCHNVGQYCSRVDTGAGALTSRAMGLKSMTFPRLNVEVMALSSSLSWKVSRSVPDVRLLENKLGGRRWGEYMDRVSTNSKVLREFQAGSIRVDFRWSSLWSVFGASQNQSADARKVTKVEINTNQIELTKFRQDPFFLADARCPIVSEFGTDAR